VIWKQSLDATAYLVYRRLGEPKSPRILERVLNVEVVRIVEDSHWLAVNLAGLSGFLVAALERDGDSRKVDLLINCCGGHCRCCLCCCYYCARTVTWSVALKRMTRSVRVCVFFPPVRGCWKRKDWKRRSGRWRLAGRRQREERVERLRGRRRRRRRSGFD